MLAEYAGLHTFARIKKHRSVAVEKNETNLGYNDILTHLLNAHDDETGTAYNDNELFGESVLLMMAGPSAIDPWTLSTTPLTWLFLGSDTTSTAITATFFYLSRHPSALEKLHQELTLTFASVDDIHPRGAETCTYLRACIDEAMRLSPPAPTNIPRLVGSGGIHVVDRIVPEGAFIGVPNFAIFRNELYFDHPHSYKPERWIVNAKHTEEEVRRAQAAFWPFSLGPRHCIAKRLAMKELSLAVAKVLFLFDIEPVEGSGEMCGGLGGEWVMQQRDVFTSTEVRVWVRFKPRQQTAAS